MKPTTDSTTPQRTVLVVDDEPCTRHLLKLLCENLGYLVQEADFGLDAMQKAKQSKPDVLIFDLKQANGQGFAIFRPEEASETAVTSLALLNQQTHWSVFTKLLKGSAMRYVPKPISSIDLGSAVQAFFAGGETAVLTVNR